MYLTYLFQRSHEGVPLPATAAATASSTPATAATENSITAVASSDSYAATASVKVPPAAPSVPEVVYTVGPPVSTAAPSPAALMPTPTPLQRQGSARSVNGAEGQGQTNTLPPAPPVGDSPQMSSPYAVPPFSPGGGGGGGAVESFTMLPRQRSVKVESNVPRYMQPKRANSTMSSSMSVGGLSGSNMMNSNGGGTTPR